MELKLWTQKTQIENGQGNFSESGHLEDLQEDER